MQPQQGPDLPTFRYEMRQIYRVAGADLDPTRYGGHHAQPQRAAARAPPTTYLRLLGLCDPDRRRRLRSGQPALSPRTRDPDAAQVSPRVLHRVPPPPAVRRPPSSRRRSLRIRSTGRRCFRCWRRVRPKFAPAPLRRHRRRRPLDAQPQRPAAPGGERAALRRRTKARAGGGLLDLVRPRTGHLPQSRRPLRQGRHRSPPASRSAGSSPWPRRRSWASPPGIPWAITAPINFIGMYQKEQSAFTRPALGFEAARQSHRRASTPSCTSSRRASRSFLNKLTSKPATAPSLFDVNAEFAFTKPDPNRAARRFSRSSRRRRASTSRCASRPGNSAAGRSRPTDSRISGLAAGSIPPTRWR